MRKIGANPKPNGATDDEFGKHIVIDYAGIEGESQAGVITLVDLKTILKALMTEIEVDGKKVPLWRVCLAPPNIRDKVIKIMCCLHEKAKDHNDEELGLAKSGAWADEILERLTGTLGVKPFKLPMVTSGDKTQEVKDDMVDLKAVVFSLATSVKSNTEDRKGATPSSAAGISARGSDTGGTSHHGSDAGGGDRSGSARGLLTPGGGDEYFRDDNWGEGNRASRVTASMGMTPTSQRTRKKAAVSGGGLRWATRSGAATRASIGRVPRPTASASGRGGFEDSARSMLASRTFPEDGRDGDEESTDEEYGGGNGVPDLPRMEDSRVKDLRAEEERRRLKEEQRQHDERRYIEEERQRAEQQMREAERAREAERRAHEEEMKRQEKEG